MDAFLELIIDKYHIYICFTIDYVYSSFVLKDKDRVIEKILDASCIKGFANVGKFPPQFNKVHFHLLF